MCIICVLEYTIRKSKLNTTGLMYYKKHQCLAFADDVLLRRMKTELHSAMRSLEDAAEWDWKLMSWTNKKCF